MTAQAGNNFDNTFSFRNTALFRPLYVNFDQYTDGDADFKKELGAQVIGNIQELKQSIYAAVQENDPEIFLKACHKIKFTLEMLNDAEFMTMIKELERDLGTPHIDGSFARHVRHFDDLCQALINSLNVEIFGKVA